jgi:aldehyde:ferredoxin oxidoreductase
MPNAYMGKIMVVDLSAGTVATEVVPDRVYEEVLSGAGLAARLLYDRVPAGADALGPDNVLAFVSGLLTGTGAQFSGRWILAGKSPLTGGWGEANCGGHLSPAIKRCGVDGIFFAGVSPTPVYLKVTAAGAQLVDASHLWGKDTVEAEEALLAEVGQKGAQVAVIGPAGENRSLIAGVSTDGGRLAARSGLGAVMGAKRLKAIVLAGKQKVAVHDAERMKALNQTFLKWFKTGMGAQALLGKGVANRLGTFLRFSPVQMAYTGDLIKISFAKYGTISTNTLSSESGDSPCKNWGGAGSRDYPVGTHSSTINPANITARESKKYHCFGCPLGCGGIVSWPEGQSPIKEMHKPEYETCCALGTLILNNDLEAIFHLNDRLNRAGMDSISAGSTVAFAIECCERGILSRADVDGLDLRWGNAVAAAALIDKMIARQGCGALFADGTRVAARKIGKGTEQYAMHAGGQELPMHDTRFDPGFAVAYSCEPTPGRHTNYSYQWIEVYALHRLFDGLPKTKAFYTPKERYRFTPEKNRLLVAASKYLQTANGCGMCQFGLQMGGNLPVPSYINAATGWTHRPEHYLEVGARIQALRQAFNVKHGVRTPVDFKLPRRALGHPPLAVGPLKNVTLDEEKLRTDFFRGMGWNPESAAPERATLEALGLDDVARDLHGAERP